MFSEFFNSIFNITYWRFYHWFQKFLPDEFSPELRYFAHNFLEILLYHVAHLIFKISLFFTIKSWYWNYSSIFKIKATSNYEFKNYNLKNLKLELENLPRALLLLLQDSSLSLPLSILALLSLFWCEEMWRPKPPIYSKR